MKQKRTVKSLIPHKADFGGKFLTMLLLVLSVVLCLGSASLMTTFVWAQESEERTNMIYSWNDGNTEVLYDLLFVDPEALRWNALDELYMEDGSLYITPRSVKLKSSSYGAVSNNLDISENVLNSKYINVLWGEWYQVSGDNITIIAWRENIIEGNNDNSSVLWWESNKLKWSSNDVPAVIAWWNKNIIENNKGDVILWGFENKINWSKNSIILWGEENEIQWGDNVIIWWKKVKVNSVSNVFAFSDSEFDFEPEFSGAFYLNLTDWVWIGVDAVKTWVSVGGAVWFWDIDGITCNSSNVWLEWVWNIGGYGCLVWCTRESSTSSKWELLDRWTLCEAKCRSNSTRCIVTWMNASLEEKSDYVGYCVIDNIDVENASRCTSWEEVSYNNVVFEGVLIDSSVECPMTGDNKCVYRCNPWYVLDWNKCVSDGTYVQDDETYECTWTPPSSQANTEPKVGSQDNLTRNIAWHYSAGETDVKCAYICSTSYHREWDKCEPNTREVECKQEWAPENSEYILKTEVQWSDDGNWPEIPNCEWNCADGFVEKDGGCHEPVATLLPWQEFNEVVKRLVSPIKVPYTADDTSITKIIHWNGDIPSWVITKEISTLDSVSPVYVWYDHWTVYYHTEADKIYFNQDTSYMFYNLKNLESIDISERDTSKVTNMDSMFFGCSSLTNLDVSNWNTANVINMGAMFQDCESLVGLDVSNWNTNNVTDMNAMFKDCGNLVDLDVSNWNTSKVTTMEKMFDYCRNLAMLDVSNWNTSKVTNMDSLFASCISLKWLDVSNWDTSNVTNMRFMFWWHQYDDMNLESLDVSNWNVGKVTNMEAMFQNCVDLTWLDVSNWNTSNVTTINHMFFGCSKLMNLDVSGWHTDSVINMSSVFYDCVSLTWLDVSNWNTSKVTTMRFMFWWHSGFVMKLENLDVSKWYTSNVTDMTSMFQECQSLTELDLSNWNTSKVVYMSGMFSMCNNLVTIYVDSWFVTSKVSDSKDMFGNCPKLVWWNWTTYNSSYIDKRYARIDGKAGKPWYFTLKE